VSAVLSLEVQCPFINALVSIGALPIVLSGRLSSSRSPLREVPLHYDSLTQSESRVTIMSEGAFQLELHSDIDWYMVHIQNVQQFL
jgi:hypothetical protein